MVDQVLNLLVARRQSEIRGGLIGQVDRIGIGPILQEDTHRLEISRRRSDHQRSLALGAARADVGALTEEGVENLRLAAEAGHQQGIVEFRRGGSGSQERNDSDVAIVSGESEPAPVFFVTLGSVGTAAQEHACHFLMPLVGGDEEGITT